MVNHSGHFASYKQRQLGNAWRSDFLAVERRTAVLIYPTYQGPRISGQLQMETTAKGRLTQPLIREHGAHRPETWYEPLDPVPPTFQQETTRGPQEFAIFSCSTITTHLNDPSNTYH